MPNDSLRNDAPARFETAADAVVAGDVAALARLLGEDPALVHARSTRAHRATLLHYVAANGVEDARQRTPPNAAEVARALLAAGAEPDALAETYGGGTGQTPLTLLVSSVHPARAGLQVALAELLVDTGAQVDGVNGDGAPLHTALAFHYADTAAALARRGARIDTLSAAAGLGRANELRRLADARGVTGADAARALIFAAALGHVDAVAFLLDRGVDVRATDAQGFTALHWAAARGHAPVVAVLLDHGAPLDVRTVYRGT
ncbi:MAG TPA: ankyrin repeat domain-containing protein, partial [Gemmatirosa sp.]